MPDGDQDIKRGRKFEQVIEGAREVFLRDGFDGASVDDIAKAAGVSKATLYSYFPDKRLLFMEVARIECQVQAENISSRVDLKLSLPDMLNFAAREFIEILTRPFNRRMYRMCVAEAERFPAVGEQFYTCGPSNGRMKIGKFLKKYVERGELAIEDIDLAADQFEMLCKADIVDRGLFLNQSEFTDAEKKRVADGAVEMFLARYGVK
ncbi:TetR/AcrR family transcriptional regulator [Marivivens donghaensis]|uniref:TetR/AcrR family transcriptional regulator n=1 Tax=Marivivens donghaensis TaxID=1699413 RepID=A0ABX0VYR8_9RHOB|nr:TetR/AcrR family transcriptional regulator [Marivivens donghaensis]NIY73220.1 TetR/AcrR family transcriptional regulator [Marivivens donghaensis]